MNMNEFDAQIDEMNQMVHELIEKTSETRCRNE